MTRPIRKYPGEEYDELLAWEAIEDERKAQDMVNAAKKILIEAMGYTTLADEEIRDGLDALPNIGIWNERIMEERNT